ncbi:hypothetical protein TNCV_4510491 [Trichonephila clavipes]|nr:hypothetical protein TNCV_4510491 [Trichonephila clavipes]
MATPPTLRLDDDTTTDDVVEIFLSLVALQNYLRSKPGTFPGMESSIQVSLIAEFGPEEKPPTPVHFRHTVDARSDHHRWRWLPHNWLLC